MSLLLAVDLGGTKTLFQLSSEQGELFCQLRLESCEFDSFDEILSAFLAQAKLGEQEIKAACIAVAGPVTGTMAKVTSLPWQLDAEQLAERFQIDRVLLCNDFEAVGYGISCLTDTDLQVLQAGSIDEKAPRAVLGAGTGLGQAILIPQQNGQWRVLPTEGGHADFAPTDHRQVLLLEHLIKRYGHVSYDRIVSGKGLVTIYHFLRDYEQQVEDPELRLAMMNEDPAAAISRFALQHHDKLANEALDLFIKIYGAQAGNVALSSLARGGVFLAGGIAGKNVTKFEQGPFMTAFLDKGRMRGLMETIPVYLVLHPEVGLLGARLLAEQSVV